MNEDDLKLLAALKAQLDKLTFTVEMELANLPCRKQENLHNCRGNHTIAPKLQPKKQVT